MGRDARGRDPVPLVSEPRGLPGAPRHLAPRPLLQRRPARHPAAADRHHEEQGRHRHRAHRGGISQDLRDKGMDIESRTC